MCNDDLKIYICMSCEEETSNIDECPSCGSTLITLNIIEDNNTEELIF